MNNTIANHALTSHTSLPVSAYTGIYLLSSLIRDRRGPGSLSVQSKGHVSETRRRNIAIQANGGSINYEPCLFHAGQLLRQAARV